MFCDFSIFNFLYSAMFYFLFSMFCYVLFFIFYAAIFYVSLRFALFVDAIAYFFNIENTLLACSISPVGLI